MDIHGFLNLQKKLLKVFFKYEEEARTYFGKDYFNALLQQIKDNINICCAVTMEPDEVLVLIDKLQKYIENETNTLL